MAERWRAAADHGAATHEPAQQGSSCACSPTTHLAGLGFGVGFEHERIPPALVKQARELDFPLFEVPFEMPFIAITEKAFGQLVNEQYETLQRGVALHKRLEQLVLEERGLEEVTRALATAIGGVDRGPGSSRRGDGQEPVQARAGPVGA